MADPATPTFQDQAPGMMAELMREFIAGKSLEARTKLRLRMKALLDFFSADTDYSMPAPAAAPPLMQRPLGLQEFAELGDSPVGRRITPAPGLPSNEDLLG